MLPWIVFFQNVDAIIGPDDAIVYPPDGLTNEMDYELELAVVIGKKGKFFSPEEAEPYALVIATGRSDYPNQINNVLCFPYIFRGALDCGATTITAEMEIATVYAIAELAQAEQSEVVAAAYAGQQLSFGPEYLIPKPFDPRLMMKIAPAVAKAAAAVRNSRPA